MTDLKSLESITAKRLLTVNGGSARPAFGKNPPPGTITTNGWTVDDSSGLAWGLADKAGEKFMGTFQAAGPKARTRFLPEAADAHYDNGVPD